MRDQKMEKERAAHNNIITMSRRRDVLDMRIKGFTYQEILSEMKKKYGNDKYTLNTIHFDVGIVLDDLRNIVKEEAEDILHIELNRLDNMQKAIYERALDGDLKAITMVLKIMTQRASLLGLNKPREIKIRDWRSDILDLVKTGKITIEQVRQEIGDELTTELLESRNDSGDQSGEVEEGTFAETVEVAGE